jgi:hypothetical protein
MEEKGTSSNTFTNLKEDTMNKTFIVVRTNFTGFHAWADAPIDVDFLKLKHRHIFYVEAKIPVSHEDRQLEFFTVKKFIDALLAEVFPNGELGRRSCEMVAEMILTGLQNNYGLNKGLSVYVFEDNENGGGIES